MKQIYKGKVLTRTKVKNRILNIYGKSNDSDRLDWYKDAHDYATLLSKRYSVSVAKCVGVISALSPVKTWSQNKQCADSFLKTGDARHMKTFENKAIEIVNSNGTDNSIKDILRGRKIISFYDNIMYPNTSREVTIDRHALSIALGWWIKDEDYAGMTDKQYKFFQDCYIYTSEILGIPPLLLQSSTWVRFRKIKNNYKQ